MEFHLRYSVLSMTIADRVYAAPANKSCDDRRFQIHVQIVLEIITKKPPKIFLPYLPSSDRYLRYVNRHRRMHGDARTGAHATSRNRLGAECAAAAAGGEHTEPSRDRATPLV